MYIYFGISSNLPNSINDCSQNSCQNNANHKKNHASGTNEPTNFLPVGQIGFFFSSYRIRSKSLHGCFEFRTSLLIIIDLDTFIKVFIQIIHVFLVIKEKTYIMQVPLPNNYWLLPFPYFEEQNSPERHEDGKENRCWIVK